ncbi:biotin--[acetyl-CoA-carboxylase] ligase [Ectothiorhodosinus mongolicus]|nr:biotin--[acetyl-CoA-carboxylase] ligase [Ectothiorhodosinus mongolicus]
MPACYVFDRLDSTNGWLDRAYREGMRGPVICATQNQYAGRGQRGRTWEMPVSSGLAFSLLWEISDWPRIDSEVSVAAANAVANCLVALGAQDIEIKWPNDVLCRAKKLCGILIESHISASRSAMILGVGINLSLPDGFDVGQPVTDLRRAGIEPLPEINALLALLVAALIDMLEGYPNQVSFRSDS